MSAPFPTGARKPLIDWVENGGTLVRFAGSRLAAAGNDEELLPVSLRLGERSLGGALSWTTPQPVDGISRRAARSPTCRRRPKSR